MGDATTLIATASATIIWATTAGFVAVASPVTAHRRRHAPTQLDGLANTDRIPGGIATVAIDGTDVFFAVLVVAALGAVGRAAVARATPALIGFARAQRVPTHIAAVRVHLTDAGLHRSVVTTRFIALNTTGIRARDAEPKYHHQRRCRCR